MVKKVLFVCLGNICRSPIAEAVFVHLIKKRGETSNWEVDSAAIGQWHIGKEADIRARKILEKYNIEYNGRARQIKKADFSYYDFIFGMDDENMEDLKRLATGTAAKAKLLLLGDFNPDGERIIRDPYYDEDDDFEKCYQQCLSSCEAFLQTFK